MEKVFAIADLHGQYELFSMVKDFLDEQGKGVICYVLGDCVDRGEKGFQILKEIIEDSRFVLLKGNHEDLFSYSIKAKSLTNLHARNGGEATVNSWIADGADEKWFDILKNLPLKMQYTNKNGQNILLSHSGYTPEVQDYYDPDEKYLWNRDHFDDDWREWYNNDIIVHGHTPIPLMSHFCWNMKTELKGSQPGPGAYYYCKDNNGVAHKINIDCGGFFTGCFTILDLDTLEQHVFQDSNDIYVD